MVSNYEILKDIDNSNCQEFIVENIYSHKWPRNTSWVPNKILINTNRQNEFSF